MVPRLRLLVLLTACPLGACANAVEEEAAALRLALERGRDSLTMAAPVPPSVAGTPIVLATIPTSGAPAQHAPDQGPALAQNLLGLGPETLRRWLGEPSLRRTEGAAEVWLYAGPACALDLVLYSEAGRLRVAHASARANGTEPRTEAHCLQELAVGLAAAPAPAATATPAAHAPDRGA
jgi:hypothetical protein